MAIDYDELARRQKALEQGSGSGSDVVWDKLTQGNNFRRILPVNDDFGIPGVKRVVHWVEQDGKNVPLTCPRTYIPDGSKQHYECPLCDWAYQNKDTNSRAASKVRGQLQYLMWAVDRDDHDTVKLLPLGKRAYESLLQALGDTDYRGMTEFTAADGGRDVNIKRTGTGLDTTYAVFPRPQCSDAVPGKDIVEVMSGLTDIPNLIPAVDMDALQSATQRLNGVIPSSVPADNGQSSQPATTATHNAPNVTAAPAVDVSHSEYAGWSIPRLANEIRTRGIQGQFNGKNSMIAALDADDAKAMQDLNGGAGNSGSDVPWSDDTGSNDAVMAAMKNAVGAGNNAATPYARKD